MAGFTDRAFREICRKWGAGFTFTEMISCEGIIRGNTKTLVLLDHGLSEDGGLCTPGELETEPFADNCVGIQLFGADPERFYRAVTKGIDLYRIALIDINCGCPVPKVVKTGAGAAMMQQPSLIGEVVRACIEAVGAKGLDIPVSVKLRSGWDRTSIRFEEAAESAVTDGAAMITLHPRTKTQGYSGKADWTHVYRLKQNLPNTPIIGSGDLFTAQDAKAMFERTGCDGVMFARGALGNPFIFSQTEQLLRSPLEEGNIEDVDRVTIVKTAIEHLKRSVCYKGEVSGTREMKKHLCSYTKGLPGSTKVRERIVRSASFDEMETILRTLL